jgi:recombination protein RecT
VSSNPPNTAMVLRQQFLQRAPEVLPLGLSAERMISVAIKCIAGAPALQRCTYESLLKSCLQAAELGLEPGGALGECYLVPFGTECTLVIGYKGLIGLCRRSGEISTIEAHVVHANDRFRYVLGTEPIVEHEPCIVDDPGPTVGVYAIAFLRGGGKQAEFMRWEDVERIRLGSKAKNSAPWTQHFDEMARKTVVRRLAKYLPTSVYLSKAQEFDGDAIEVEAKPARARPPSLKERAAAHANPPPETDVEPASDEPSAD